MWPNPQETADLVAFTEEIVNGKLQFLIFGAKDIEKTSSPVLFTIIGSYVASS